MRRRVTVVAEGDKQTHASAEGAACMDHATLCGVDGHDLQQEVVPTPRGQKIDCAQCKDLFNAWRKFRASDFE